MKDEAIRTGLELMQKGIEMILLNLDPDEAREPTDQLLNTRQLREFSGLSQPTVSKIIKRMDTGVFREGRAIRVSRNQFLKTIEGSKK